MTDKLQPILDAPALDGFLKREFPQVADEFQVIDVASGSLTVRLVPGTRHLRPGGTISGPTMFSLADCAVYLAIIAHVGEEALAVTTNASIDFMRKPAADADLLAEATLLKLGRRLAVADVALRNPGASPMVARATMTYSRPNG